MMDLKRATKLFNSTGLRCCTRPKQMFVIISKAKLANDLACQHGCFGGQLGRPLVSLPMVQLRLQQLLTPMMLRAPRPLLPPLPPLPLLPPPGYQ